MDSNELEIVASPKANIAVAEQGLKSPTATMTRTLSIGQRKLIKVKFSEESDVLGTSPTGKTAEEMAMAAAGGYPANSCALGGSHLAWPQFCWHHGPTRQAVTYRGYLKHVYATCCTVSKLAGNTDWVVAHPVSSTLYSCVHGIANLCQRTCTCESKNWLHLP